MKRREFIAGLGSAAAWPVVVRAQQPVPVIGYLGSMAEADVNRLRAFRQGLGEAGFAEGRNVTIEYRGTASADPRLPELAADLIRRQASVIVANVPVARRVKAVTSTIPIMFWGVVDPVQVGLVASLNRPGANVTGVISMGSEIGGKQLSLMHDLLPSAVRYALLVNSNGLVIGGPLEKEMQSVAGGVGGQFGGPRSRPHDWRDRQRLRKPRTEANRSARCCTGYFFHQQARAICDPGDALRHPDDLLLA